MAAEAGEGSFIHESFKNSHFSNEGRERIYQAFNSSDALKTFRIPKCRLTDDVIPDICELFQRNEVLIRLMLDESTFSTDGIKAVLQALKSNQSLKHLSLCRSQLTDRVLPALIDFLKINETFQTLQVNGSTFTDKGMVKLLHALTGNISLRGISLWTSRLTDEVVPAFAYFLTKNQTLQTLQMSRTTLSNEGMVRVLRALTRNISLQGISFWESSLSDHVVPSLVDFLSTNTVLQFLQISKSKFTDKGMVKLLHALTGNISLRGISIWDSSLTDKVVPALVNFLASNTTFETLQLMMSRFTDVGMSMILQACANNSTLIKLIIGHSELTDVVAVELSAFINGNKTLESLIIGSSRFTNVGMSKILRALQQQQVLKHFCIYESTLTDMDVPAVCEFVERNTALQHLQIYGGQFTHRGIVRLLQALSQQQVLIQFWIGRGSQLTDAIIPALCDFLTRNTRKKSLWLGSNLSDIEVADILEKYVNIEETVRLTGKLESASGTLRELEKRLHGDDFDVLSDSRISSATQVSEESGVGYLLGSVFPVDMQGTRAGEPKEEIDDSPKTTGKGAPKELYNLSSEHVKAYEKACAGGKQTVNQCRVMLVGHEGAGKSNILRTLLSREFEKKHIPTNSMQVEINKTKKWCDHIVESEYDEKTAEYIVKTVNDKTKSAHDKQQDVQIKKQVTHHRRSDVTSRTADVKDDRDLKLRAGTRVKTTQPNIIGPMGEVDITQHQSHAHDHRGQEKSVNLKEAGQKTKLPPGVMEAILKQQNSHERNSAELFFWDSGGQGVFYNTSKTFLSRRCIFIIAMDMTKGLDDEVKTERKNRHGKTVLDTGCPQTVREHLKYWLRCIQTFAFSTESSKDQASPSIILVCTHKDEMTSETAETYVESIRDFLESQLYIKDKMPQVLTISNLQRDKQDISKVKESIDILANKQVYELPLTWINFKEKLLQSADNNLPIKTWEEAKALGLELGITDDTDVEAALLFYHEVGDLLFFNESSLKDLIVTHPQWLIDQIRQVITVPKYHDKKDFLKKWVTLEDEGVLHEDILHAVWPEKVREQLVILMKKFALLLDTPPCYIYDRDDEEEDGKKCYLVPCLLPLKEPDSVVDPDYPLLLLIPHDRFMPVGLTSRLFAGLVNEDDWKVVERIYGDAAKFYPKGEESSISISILQRADHIELQGKPLDDDCNAHCNDEFSEARNIILCRLDAIRTTVCPQPKFRVKMYCSLKGCREEINLGEKGEKIKEKIVCKGHKCTTSNISVWFNISQKRMESPQSRDDPDGDLTYEKVETIITEHKPRIFQRLKLSPMLLCKLAAAKVLGPADMDELDTKSMTNHQKIDTVLNTIVQKGVETFLEFCVVLDDEPILQSHVVTKVMGLSMDYIRKQRNSIPPKVDTSSRSPKVDTSSNSPKVNTSSSTSDNTTPHPLLRGRRATTPPSAQAPKKRKH